MRRIRLDIGITMMLAMFAGFVYIVGFSKGREWLRNNPPLFGMILAFVLFVLAVNGLTMQRSYAPLPFVYYSQYGTLACAIVLFVAHLNRYLKSKR